MNRRPLFVLPVGLACLVLAGSTPSGQPRASLSADLARAHARGQHTHRVIVQGDGSGLLNLRRGGLGLLRRDLGDAVAIEVTDAQLDALQRNPQFQHISGDLPVVGDMAITNKVTAATAVWRSPPPSRRHRGCASYRATPCSPRRPSCPAVAPRSPTRLRATADSSAS